MFVMASSPPIFRAGGGNEARAAIHFTRTAHFATTNPSRANPPCPSLPVHARQTPPHETIPWGQDGMRRREEMSPGQHAAATWHPNHRNSFAARRRFPAPRHPDRDHFSAGPTHCLLDQKKVPLQEMARAEQPGPGATPLHCINNTKTPWQRHHNGSSVFNLGPITNKPGCLDTANRPRLEPFGTPDLELCELNTAAFANHHAVASRCAGQPPSCKMKQDTSGDSHTRAGLPTARTDQLAATFD